MLIESPGRWWVRTATFLFAAVAAVSAAYWALKWGEIALPSQTTRAVVPVSPQTDPQIVARFLSGSPVAIEQVPGMPAASVTHRLKLTGVVAEGANRGYALIAIDGKPSRPFRVGTSVTEDLVLVSVAPRSAFLANRVEGPVTMTLDLPQLSKP